MCAGVLTPGAICHLKTQQLKAMSIEEPSTSNKKYWQRLRILSECATRDFLTGLLNRVTATQYIENCLKAMPHTEKCALFIIDLDHFKTVNDTFGHQAGDKLIWQAASQLSRCFRVTDIVGRLGGDEFIALLAGNVTREIVAERVRTICERLQFCIGGQHELRITPSVGVHIAGAGISFETLYARADASLSLAKQAGCNSFHISDECTGDTGCAVPNVPAGVAQLPISVHTLLSHMDEGIALLDVAAPLRVLYASPVLLKFLGMRSAEVTFPCLPQDLGEVHADNEAEFRHLVQESASSNKAVEYELRYRARGSGDWRWYRVKMVQGPMGDGGHRTILLFCTDISASRRIQTSLTEEQELLHLLLSQRDRFLWSVDIESGTFSLFNSRHHIRRPVISLKNFPEGVLARGWVHPVSVSRFRNFARDLMQGNVSGGCALALRNTMSRTYRWFSVFYHLLPETQGRRARIIGVMEPLAGMSPKTGFFGADRLWEVLRPSLLLYLHANLSANEIGVLWNEGRSVSKPGYTYSQLIQRSRSRLFFPEKARDFARQFDRQTLLEAFASGQFWISREYRRVDSGGNIRWCGIWVCCSPWRSCLRG